MFVGVGLTLIAGSRRELPARWLGLTFCLFGSLFADPLLAGVSYHRAGLDGIRHGFLAMSPVAMVPLYFWRFAWDFPRRQPALLPAWAPRRIEASLFGVGLALFVAMLVTTLAADGLAARTRDVAWTIVVALQFPTLALLIAKVRTALPEERRRVALFIAGLVLGMVPLLVDILLSGFVAPYREYLSTPGRTRAAALVISLAILLVPVITVYAVVVDRVLETRLIVRQAIQYALARYSVFSLMGVPIVLLAAYLYRHRQQPLVDIFTQAPPQVWLVTLGLVICLALVRRPLLLAIDRRYFREQHDAREILASLSDSTRRAASLEQLSRLVAGEIDKALHVNSVTLLCRGEDRYEDPLDGIPPLPSASTLATLVAGSASALDIDTADSASPLRRLPASELDWLGLAHARLLLPLLDAMGALIGLLVLGDKRSETRYSAEDRFLLQAVAASAAAALQKQLRARTPSAAPYAAVDTYPDHEAAKQCDRCDRIFESSVTTCQACNAAVREAPVPILIAAKFKVVRRLGSGGMGVVYRAQDITLNRPVAIKTLPRLSDEAARRLRREARALATLYHPHLEGIYGVESWRGIPMLVLEYLPRGTLATRLQQGALSLPEVTRIGAAMADALHSLHRAGVLHRDVKPSNIGFTDDNTPKLLDFGLAVVAPAPTPPSSSQLSDFGETATRTHTELAPVADPTSGKLAGTPIYMSPEALAGEPPEVSFDLWGLAVTLFEAVAAKNPFVSGDRFETARLISSGTLPDIRLLRPDCPEAFAAFLEDALSLQRRRRPADAREFGARLRSVQPAG